MLDPLGYGALLGVALVGVGAVVMALRAVFGRPALTVVAGRSAGRRLDLQIPEVLPECTALLCADQELEDGFGMIVAGRWIWTVLVDADLGLPRASTVEEILRQSAAGDDERLAALVSGLQLEPVLDRPFESLDAVQGRRVKLAWSLAKAGIVQLVVASEPGLPARERADLLACLRWLRAAHGLRIVYGIRSTADLEDLADALVVVDEQGRVYGPGEPWELLGATWRGPLVERLDVVSTLTAKVDYLDEEGRWLRVLACGDREVYLPFQRLSPGWLGRIAIRPESVLLLPEPLPGPRLTNQIRGRVQHVGDLLGRSLVAVDVGGGELLRALAEPDTVRGLGLLPGASVVCVFEPGAVRWAAAAP